VFAATVLGAMVIDWIAFSKRDDSRFFDATLRSVYWIVVGLLFGGYVTLFVHDPSGVTHPGLDYFVAYVVEKSLSVDNLFVFLVIFRYFQIKPGQQHRVLFWGIAGALVMRGLFIGLGTAALQHFHWVMYGFGAFLVWSGAKLLFRKEADENPENSWILRWSRKHLRVAPEGAAEGFFTRLDGRLHVTPLFLVLLVVEATDVAFAVDSVPAVLAVSKDLLVVYSSNVMAILGLRALFFMLSGMMGRFHYLDRGLSVILVFIGVKMLLSDVLHIPNWLSLGVIAGALGAAVAFSLLRPPATDDES
jgi:tellurite resistance protein TerC